MFLRIAGLVGSVLFLVYLADDYIAANNPNLVASTEPSTDIDDEGAVDIATAPSIEPASEPVTEVAAQTEPVLPAANKIEIALVTPEPTKEIEVQPMTVASALSTREIELPPLAEGDSESNGGSFLITRQLDREEPKSEVTQAALRPETDAGDDALELRQLSQPTARAGSSSNESLVINLMIVSAPNAAIHAAPSRQAGIKAVVNAGFVVTAFDVKGSDWIFVQDTNYTVSGYIRANQLKPLLLTN